MTTQAVASACHISPQYVCRLRNGGTVFTRGKPHYYPPILIEGTDYVWNRGRVKHNKRVVKIILEHMRTK